MRSSGQIRTLFNTWLQTGNKEALSNLVEEFSAICQAHDNDGPNAFKEFLFGLRVIENASEETEHEAIEPLYDFTGFAGFA